MKNYYVVVLACVFVTCASFILDAHKHKKCYSGYAHDDTVLAVPIAECEKKSFVTIHNNLRNEFDIAPLQWDDELAQSALQWAKKLASDGDLYHSHGADKGENLYWGASNYGKRYTLSDAAQAWADEKSLQRGKKFDPQSNAGHYTQMIWRDTKKVGAAVMRRGNDYYIVAHYAPAGNWVGRNIY